MKKLPAAILIAIGSFLEVFYYAWRFVQDGSPWWLAWTIGVGLTLFLSVLTILRESRSAKVLALFLITYSVIATTAGQAFAMASKNEVRSVTEAQEAQSVDMAAYYREQIATLNAEYRENQALLATDLQNLAQWKTNGVQPIRERQTEIERLRSEYEERLTDVVDSLTTHETVERVETNIYTFFAQQTNANAFFVQIVLQAALSVFIALMAPTGIILLTSGRSDPAPTISKWVDISWSVHQAGRGEYLMSKESVLKFDRQRFGVLSPAVYDRILKKAIRRGAVRIDEEGHAIPVVSSDKAKQLLC